jgi:hypothetical protein
MADGDHTVILPGQRPPTIARNEGGMAERLGAPLRQRLPNIPILSGDGTGPDVIVDVRGEDGSGVVVGDDGTVQAELPHVFVRGTGTQNDNPADFGENLAQTLDEGVLSNIAAEVIEGVEADQQSRTAWVEQYTKGIDLLALKIEDPGQQGGGSRGVSRAGHTLLIEAMVKQQAAAGAEMLPAMGPVKVPTIGDSSEDEEQRAADLAADMNYYLTDVATEYYPDTESMLMHQAYCGIGYKKIYRDPIRRRPVSESVLAPDMIVSEEATDLDSALRVTHSIQMLKGQLRRMQLVGHYREIDLGMPMGGFGLGRQAQQAINRSQGISNTAQRPQDQPYEIWETDTELDVDYLGIDGRFERQTPWGLPLPYKITLDHQSRQVLGVWRNWRPEDALYQRRNMFVKFGMVPGLGFHSWGFLQLLGNQTRTLRAILRLMIDSGMFSNFPGGVKFKNARTATNEIAPRPGEFVDIDAVMGPNADISKLWMPLPYKTLDPVFVQLAEQIKNDAKSLGATVDLEVGEGRTNMPVGTVLAMIEQQVQVMAAVLKRNHRAQKQELHKLRELFAENPSDLSTMCRGRPQASNGEPRMWQLAEEFMDLDLSPASDPNVPSRVHQIMAANIALLIGQQAGPLVDMTEILKDAFRAIGRDPARYVVQPAQGAPAPPPPPPDPKIVAATITAQQKQQQEIMETQAQQQKLEVDREKMAAQASEAAAGNETALEIARTKAAADTAQPYHEAAAAPQPANNPLGSLGEL